MTLVAAFKINDVPLIVGDMLVTDEVQGPHHVISTRPDMVAIQKGERRRSGAVLKLSILNERLVVGFTGQVASGEKLLRELKTRYSSIVPTRDELNNALRTSNLALNGRAHLVGWLANPDPECFSWSAKPGAQVNWVQQAFMGSGAKHFQQSILPNDQSAMSAELNDEQAVPFIALTKLNKLLSSELGDASTFANNYGFGGEVAVWDGEKFAYQDRMTFIVFSATVSDEEVAVTPFMVRIYERRARYALLQTGHLYDHDGPDGSTGKHTYQDLVGPLEGDISDLTPSQEFLDPRAASVICVAVAFQDRPLTQRGFLHFAGDHQQFEFSGEPKDFRFGFKDPAAINNILRTSLGFRPELADQKY